MMKNVTKRIAIALTAATMTLTSAAALPAFTQTAFAEEMNRTEYVTASTLSVRTEPNTSAPSVGELKYGTDVCVTGTLDGSDWVEINYNGYKRYVCGKYLSESKPAGSSLSWLKTNSNVATKQDYKVSVSSGYLALRSGTSYENSNEIGKLYNGTEVQLVNQGDGTYWSVIVPSTGQTGYVNSNYLV